MGSSPAVLPASMVESVSNPTSASVQRTTLTCNGLAETVVPQHKGTAVVEPDRTAQVPHLESPTTDCSIAG